MLRAMAMQTGGLFDREILADELCLVRLEEAALARVLISVRCMPAALPVFIHLTDHHLLLASDEEAVIEAARRGDVLAVQVDGADGDRDTWSVQATGVAHLPNLDDALGVLGTNSKLASSLDRGASLIAISLMVVSGERVHWTFPRG